MLKNINIINERFALARVMRESLTVTKAFIS